MYSKCGIVENGKSGEGGSSAGPNNGAISRTNASLSSGCSTPQSKLCLPLGSVAHGRGQTLRDLLASIPGFSMKVKILQMHYSWIIISLYCIFILFA